MLFEINYVNKAGLGRIGYVNAKTAFEAKAKALKNPKVAKVENVNASSPANKRTASGAMLDSATLTLDDIKAKYSVQNDADMSYGFMAKFSGVETFSIRAESAEKAEAKAKAFFDEKMRKAGVRVNNVTISKPKRLGVM